MTLRKPSLLVVGNTHSHVSAKAFITNFVRIAGELASQVYILSADAPPNSPNVHWIKAQIADRTKPGARPILFAISQLAICLRLRQLRGSYDQAIILPSSFVLPVLWLRILGKRVAVHVDGKPETLVEQAACRASFHLASDLMTQAWKLLDYWGIRSGEKAKRCAQFVDTVRFRRETPFAQRKRVVGFLGTLDRNKGVREFLSAIQMLNSAKEEILFLVGGTGLYESLVTNFSSLNPNVLFEGVIPWDEVAAFLNRCRLVVIPSFSEGLPNVMLEAMACGTPVLATPVGGIPDVIVDRRTGYIVPTNDPAVLAKHILHALNDPNLEGISDNALMLAQGEFSFRAAVERYARIIQPHRDA